MPSNLNGTIDTGAMKVNTLVETVELLCGQRHQIANGFQTGQSVVKCASLADQTVGTATNDHIALGSSAYVNGKLITGSLPVRDYLTDQVSKESNSDGSITLGFPRGIYTTKHPSYNYPVIKMNQSELVTTIGLTATKIAKGKTYLGIAGTYTSDATAAASDIKKGKTAFVNGMLVTGTLIAQSPSNISAQTNGPTSITLSWYNPSVGPFAGVQIRMSTSGYPGKTGGSVVYTGAGSNGAKNGKSSVAITGLSGNTQYYFTVYGQCGTLDTSEGYLNVSAKTAVSRGSQTFLTSGIFTVPQYVYEIEACIVGAGGSTGRKDSSGDSYQTWAIGGGGGMVKNIKIAVTPGQQIPIVVGAPIHSMRTNEKYEFSYVTLSKTGYPDWPELSESEWIANGSVFESSVDVARSGSSMVGDIEAKGGVGCSTIRGLAAGMPGGSGSAGASCLTRNEYYPSYLRIGSAGSNGQSGGNTVGDGQSRWVLSIGGKGQSTTTWQFGDPDTILYSTAGETGIDGRCIPGEDNTGNGATGAGWNQYVLDNALGGSGIVVLRWGN